MKLGIISSCALGLAVALTIGAAPARAQNAGSGADTTARAGTTVAPGSTSGTTTARTGRNGTTADSMNMNLASGNDTAGTARMRHRRGIRHGMRHHHRRMASNGAVSSQRIPLTKSTSGGEVEPVDTTTQAPPPAPTPTPTPIDTTTRVDTTTQMNTTPVDTTTQRVDTTSATPAPPISMRRLGSFYWGIGGGAAMPSEQTRNGFHTGWNITVPFGWDPARFPLGLRFDGGYSRMMGRSDVGVGTDVGVWSGNADLKLRAPFSSMLSLLNHVYGVGGIGVSRIVGYGKSDNTSTTPTGQANGYGGAYANGTQISNSFGNAKTEFGWNAGGGVSFGWGRSALFLESRYFSVNTSSSFGAKTHFVPIILGLTFR